MRKFILIALVFIITLFIILESSMAIFFSKNLDANEFNELVSLLPEGAASERSIRKINLQDFVLKIDNLNDLHFSSCVWKNIDAKGKSFNKVIFENCEFSGIDFTGATLNQVTFINCKLSNVVMNSASISQMRFVNSKLSSSDSNILNGFRGLKADEISFENSELIGINFFESKAILRFNESKLYDVSGVGLLQGSALYFIKTHASLIDFGQSVLSNLEIIDSTIDKRSKAVGGDIKSIVVKNSDLDFPMGFTSNIDSAVFEGSGDVIVGRGTNIKSTRVSNCPKGTRKVNVGGKNFGEIYIDNCHVSEISFPGSQGKLVSIKNSSAYGIDFRNSKIDHLILDNVKVTARLKYHKTNIGKLESKNITFKKYLKIWNEDSNIEIKPDDVLEAEIPPQYQD